MGNQPASNKLATSFTSYRIKESPDRKILGLHLIPSQFPSSGVLLVGTHFIENYEKDGAVEPYSIYYQKSKFIDSAMVNVSGENILLLLAEDGFISFVDSRNLKFEKSFLLQIDQNEIEQENLTFQDKDDISNLKVVKIFPFQENKLLASFNFGLSFIYDLEKTIKIKTLNPYTTLPKSETHVFEDNPIPEISLFFPLGSHNEFMCIHKKEVISKYGNLVTKEEVPIYHYQCSEEEEVVNGTLVYKGCSFNILNAFYSKPLNFIIALACNNTLLIWKKGNPKIIMTIDFNRTKIPACKSGGLFVMMSQISFPESNETDPNNKSQILFAVDNIGNIVLSQIIQNGNELKWEALKLLKNIPSNMNTNFSVSSLQYLQSTDCIYMVDGESRVCRFEGISKQLPIIL